MTRSAAGPRHDPLPRLVCSRRPRRAFTGPSFNSILPILGALVVEEGGALCHAAIVAREFGLPAVIGAREATSLIADGVEVEVDPIRGVVRPL